MASKSFADAVHDLATNQTTYTINGVDFGTEASDRFIVVALTAVTASGVAPDSMTIGGVAATEQEASAAAGTPTIAVAIWSAPVPTGTSGTIEFSVPSGDMDGGSIYVWAAYGIDETPIATAAAEGIGGSRDVSLNVLNGGLLFAISALSNVGAQTFTLVGTTKDDEDVTPNLQSAAGSAVISADESPRTVTFSVGRNAVAVAFGPGAVVTELGQGSLAFSGQSAGGVLSQALGVGALAFAGQSAAFNTTLALSPAALAIAGQNIGFAYLQVDPAIFQLMGQNVPLRLLAPSRVRSALRMPGSGRSTDGRMVTYWKGTRG